jgi:formate hydrogenlyase transcriptional activator
MRDSIATVHRIPSALLESELFGHERSAFTGTVSQTMGRFQQIDNGTLFLDEIGDLPLELQPKILRALQEQEFERLGCGRTIRVNVRSVAATNQGLAQMVSARQFRADVYYRLNVIPIVLPPLRERPDDIPRLVEHFVRKFSARMNKPIDTIPDEVMECLKFHDWPGNIRELQNFIERAVVFSQGTVLRPTLTEFVPHRETAHSLCGADLCRGLPRSYPRSPRTEPLDDRRPLGLPRITLIYKMRKFGIDPRTATSPPNTIAASERARCHCLIARETRTGRTEVNRHARRTNT